MKYRILILVFILTLSLLCSCVEKQDHSHSFSEKFSSDETHHWHQCECKEKDGIEDHVWDEGKIILFPTTEKEGQKAYICTVCSYKRIEVVEKLTETHIHIIL